MTNIAQLPTGLSGSIPVVTNADWRTTLQFAWPPGGTNAGQPLDLTGIAFRIQLRASATDNAILLDLSTTNGLLTTQPQLGQLSFAVPIEGNARACTSGLNAGTTAVMDIIAMGDGQTINLCQDAGPIAVPISTGVTRNQLAPAS